MLSAEVRSIHDVTPRVKQFKIRRTDGATFDFEPGQHTRLHVEDDGEYTGEGDGEEENGEDGDDGEIVRPYTPTTLPGTDEVTLAIKRYDDGTASRYMHDRDPGDAITIEEPGGNLYLRDLERDIVFVSTGTGITPPMAMLRHYLRAGGGEAHFLYGEKTQADVMYRETLDGLAAEHEELSVAYSLSEEEWPGYTGHVQEHIEDALGDVEGRHFYVCGVPEMVVQTTERLADLGVPDDHVFTEGWENDEVSGED